MGKENGDYLLRKENQLPRAQGPGRQVCSSPGWSRGKKGDRVALLLLNCPQFAIAYFASLKVGAVLTPVSPVYVTPEIRHQLEDSQAETIICQDILYDYVERTELKLKRII